MGKSIKRQLEDMSYSASVTASTRAAAIKALRSEEWLSLMKGRQAYYRDFVLAIIAYFVDAEMDDSPAESVVRDITESGFLWTAMTTLNHNKYLPSNMVYASVRSLMESGTEVTPENARTIMYFYLRCYSERPSIDMPFVLGACENIGWMRLREIHGFTPEVTRRMAAGEVTPEALVEIAQRGIVRDSEALAILDEKVLPVLSSGSL